MNWLDYLLIFIFVINLYNGFKEGLIRQIVGLAGFFIALYCAVSWNGDIGIYLRDYLNLDKVIESLSRNGNSTLWLPEVFINIIAFLLIFIVFVLFLKIITGRLKIINKIPIIGPLNIALGAVLGMVKGFLVIFLVAALLSLIKTPFMSNTLEASVIFALSQHYMSILFNFIYLYVVENLGQLV